jgi:hypothetical protein
MRFLLATALLLAGCSSAPKPTSLPPAPPPAPVQQTALLGVWEKEVAEDLAIFKAIRPSLSGPAPALNLYDSATQGLASLSGEPTAKAIDRFKEYVDKPDQNRLDALRSEKLALDRKTDELERKVKAEEEARIRAEAQAAQARKDKEAADKAASLAESASRLTEYGTYAIAAGVLALLFGHWLGIQKWVAGLTIGAGVLVAATARPLIDFFGSDKSEWVLLGTLGFLAINLAAVMAIKSWRLVRPCKPDAQA